MSIRVAIVLALGLLVAPAAARADDARAAAERAFRTGERLFNAGEFADAAGAFETALKTMPVPAIEFSTAQAHRLAWVKQGNAASLRRAVELYRAYVAEVKKGQRVADATAALAALEPDLKAIEARGGVITGGPPRTTAFLVTSQIEGATATLDGASAGALPLVLEVKPGAHAVVVEAPGYEPKTVNATALDGERLPIEVELVAKPAMIAIKAEAGAEVSVDGRAAGTLPLAQPITVPAGRHFIAVSRRGRSPVGRDVEVERGATLELAVPLRSTSQRRAVKWVLVGGGVLALGAGAAALVASQRDSDAAELRARTATTGIDLTAASRYDELRAQRDDARTLTWVLGGASIATVVAGGLMYWLDHERTAPSTWIAPVATSGGGSVTVGGQF